MVKKDYEYYRKLAADMIEDDGERDKKDKWMDDADNVNWTPPDTLTSLPWFTAIPSTGPHDALDTGTRVLSTVIPRPTFYPLDNEPESKERAELIEKVLMWQYNMACNRGESSVTWDVIMSAIKYGRVCAQVIYNPWQEKLLKKKQEQDPEYELPIKMWGQNSDYTIIVYPPRDVHTKRTTYGKNVVLLRTIVPAAEVVQSWGGFAKEIANDMDEHQLEKVILCDLTDSENRCVWAIPSPDDTMDNSSSSVMSSKYDIYLDKHGLPFFPWVVRSNGSNLDKKPENQSRPLLDPIYKSGLWHNTNISRSLEFSLMVAHAAFPRSTTETQTGEPPEINYDTPGGNVALRTGEKFIPNQPPPIDPNLQNVKQNFETEMGSSTVPKLLQDPNYTSGAAFASINTLLDQASSKLDPFRVMAQNAFSDIYSQMLFWIIHTEDSLIAYNTTRKKNYGMQMEIKGEEIDPDCVFITTKLTASLPIDKVSRLNAGMLMKNLEVPTSRIYEELDITDPSDTVEEFITEQFERTEWQNRVKVKTAQADAEAQRILGQVQMEQQSQMQSQAMAQQQPPQPDPNAIQGQEAMAAQQAMAKAIGGMPPDQQMESAGFMTQAAQDQMGFNPAMGGTPPAMLAPENTKQNITQRDSKGRPLA